jgi:hypothetical protein
MLNAIRTHGRYGALNTKRPKKLRRVSGFRRLQIYTRLDDNAGPRKSRERNGERIRREVIE